MKAFVAIDSFKGSLSTFEAAAAVREALDGQEVVCFPMSDGGEGFCDVVESYLEGERVSVKVSGPFGTPVEAAYFIAGRTAYIESAAACGYTLAPKDPFKATSYGLGSIIADAAQRGVDRIVVGLGGTCTVDAGVGMLQALGAQFRLKDGSLLPEKGPALLGDIVRIDLSRLQRPAARLEIWSDTEAPMYGRRGAAYLYGRQKGLSDSDIPAADAWLRRLARLYPGRVWLRRGYGAAGGIAAALASVLGARMCRGAEEIIALSGLRERLFGIRPDILVTGEGKFDRQTLTGKLPSRIAAAGAECRRRTGVPKTLCFAGKVEPARTSLFEAVIPITPEGTPEDEALRPDVAEENLKAAVRKTLLSL